eukprot:tig00021070_g17856.t1
MAAHADWISSLLVAAEPRLLISASRDSTIKARDLDAFIDVPASLGEHKGPATPALPGLRRTLSPIPYLPPIELDRAVAEPPPLELLLQ